MDNKVGSTFVKTMFKWDYEFYQRFFHLFVALTIPFNILFYFVLERLAGYQESLALRGLTVLLLSLMWFMPRVKPLSFWQKMYVELTYAVGLPLLFTYSLLINDANSYWVSSLVFSGLIYGLLAQQIFGFINLVLVTSITTFVYNHYYDLSDEVLKSAVLAYFVSATMYVMSAAIRTMFQLSYLVQVELSAEKAKFEQSQKNLKKMQAREEVIRRYVRPSLLTEVALGLDPLEYPPQKITTSVLFIDMRNYTAFSEVHTEKEGHEVLNNYFNIINDAVFKNGGEVDKIMGDAVMATVPAPENCFDAALDMWMGICERNAYRYKNNMMPIRFGMGASYGEVLSANFGSKQKFDRTIVGDIVNIGSRLEQLTKTYFVDILVTETFMNRVLEKRNVDTYRIVDEVYVKGKTRPIVVYEVFGHNNSEVYDFKISTKKDLELVVNLKRSQQYFDALEIINVLIDRCPKHRYDDSLILDMTLTQIKKQILDKIKEQNPLKGIA